MLCKAVVGEMMGFEYQIASTVLVRQNFGCFKLIKHDHILYVKIPPADAHSSIALPGSH